MGLLLRMLGRDPAQTDEPISQQLAAVTREYEQLRQHYEKEGIGLKRPVAPSMVSQCDTVDGAAGPFGLCPTNPIPVNGVAGERVYLHRLFTLAGQPLQYHRMGSIAMRGSDPIDEYEVMAFDGSIRLSLFFAMQFPRRSRLAPSGFFLRSWRNMTEIDRSMAKLGAWGTNTFVSDFPRGIEDVVIDRAERMGLPGGTTLGLLRALRNILIEHYAQPGSRRA